MRGVLLAPLVLCLGAAGVASADPVRPVTGSVFIGSDGLGTFGFAFIPRGAPGTFVFTSGSAGGGSGDGSPAVPSFGAGGAMSLSGSLAVSPGRAQHKTSDADDRGTRHGGSMPAVLQDNPGAFVMAGAAHGGPGAVDASFSAQDLVQLFTRLEDAHPIFMQMANANGNMSHGDHNGNNGNGRFFVTDKLKGRKLASDTGAATPEPASVLLLGVGLAAAWQSRRVRRES